MLVSADRGKVRLISCKIIFQEFQLIGYMITIPQRQTDRQMGGYGTDNLPWQYRAVHSVPALESWRPPPGRHSEAPPPGASEAPTLPPPFSPPLLRSPSPGDSQL